MGVSARIEFEDAHERIRHKAALSNRCDPLHTYALERELEALRVEVATLRGAVVTNPVTSEDANAPS